MPPRRTDQGHSDRRRSRHLNGRSVLLETRVFHPEIDKNAIAEAAEIIRRGGLLGIPTETVYGLGADALNEDAVKAIFAAKGRPQDNPLIIHVPSCHWLERYCRDIPDTAYRLAERFWPGPLTMILPRRENVPLLTTGGLETVGVRCPDHPVTLAIIEKAGVPVAAPSGNTSGRPSPTTAAHMLEDMEGKIDGIVDGGPCRVGVESTIIDLTVTPPRLLRPGGLPLESLREVLGDVVVDSAVKHRMSEGEKPRAPGMKYRHYAPKASVTVVTGEPVRSAAYISSHLAEGDGVICFSEFISEFAGHIVHDLGPSADCLTQAQHVFDALRTFDSTGVTRILAQCPDEKGLGFAVGNRLKKAAGFMVVDVGKKPFVIGITGPTGSGKTSALNALKRLGARIIDCDAVYHEMLKQDSALQKEITDAFGDVFNREGLDRKKLGSIVFSDPDALNRLNSVVYTRLIPEIRKLVYLSDESVVGVDAINLFESSLNSLCDRTVGVIAPAEIRVKRIMERDGIREEYARLRIGAQKDEQFYRRSCTDILMNDSASLEEFENKAYAFFCHMLKRKKEEDNHE